MMWMQHSTATNSPRLRGRKLALRGTLRGSEATLSTNRREVPTTVLTTV